MALPIFTWRGAILTSDLPSTTRHILLTLSCYMNEMGDNCFPSIESICDGTGLSNRAVLTHLKVAADRGWITVEKHGYGGQRWARNQYYLTYPNDYVEVVNKKGSERGDKKAVNDVPIDEKVVNVIPKGSERGDKKAVNDVHTNSSKNFLENSPQRVGDGQSKKQVQEEITWDDQQKIFTGISDAQMQSWEEAFPKLDIDSELTRIELWYDQNPKKRKRQVKRFITGWLSRAFQQSQVRKVFVKQPSAQSPPVRVS